MGADVKKTFAKNLNYWLEKRDLTQADIVKELNISASTVSDWCLGKKFPRIGKIEELATFLNILKSDLIEEKNSNEINDESKIKLLHRNFNELTKKQQTEFIQTKLSEMLNDKDDDITGL